MKLAFFNTLSLDEDGNIYQGGKIAELNGLMPVRFGGKADGPFAPFILEDDIRYGSWRVYRFPVKEASDTGYYDVIRVGYHSNHYDHALIAPSEDGKRWLVHIFDGGELVWGKTVADITDDLESDWGLFATFAPRWSGLFQTFREKWLASMGGVGEPHFNVFDEDALTQVPDAIERWVSPDGGTVTGDIIGETAEFGKRALNATGKALEGIGSSFKWLPIILVGGVAAFVFLKTRPSQRYR